MKVNWYYWVENREVGPLTRQQLELIASQKRIGPDTRVREGVDGRWVAARTVAGLFPLPVERPAANRANPPVLPAANSSGSIPISPSTIPPNSGIGRNYVIIGVAACAMLAIVAVVATLSGEGESRPSSSPISPRSDIRHNVAADDDWRRSIADKAKRSVVVVQSPAGHGSGFVVAVNARRDLIVTNKHVLVGDDYSSVKANSFPKRYLVITESGRQFTAQLAALAIPDELDLAVLLVESSELEVLGSVASFDDVRKADEVVAVGTPLGLELFNSVTPGYVQAKVESYYIATDASINPGNSGGPLIDKQGRIIGVNDLKFKSSAKNVDRLGLAIRADFLLDKKYWTFFEDVSDLFREIKR